jgi:hypothetical protein
VFKIEPPDYAKLIKEVLRGLGEGGFEISNKFTSDKCKCLTENFECLKVELSGKGPQKHDTNEGTIVEAFKVAIEAMKFSDTGSIFPDDKDKNATTLLMLLTLLSYPAEKEPLQKDKWDIEQGKRDNWQELYGSCLYHTALFTTDARGSGPKGAYFNDRVSGSPNTGFSSLYDKCAQVMPAMGDFFKSVADAVSNWLKNSFSVSFSNPTAVDYKKFIYNTFFSPQSFGGAFLCYNPDPDATKIVGKMTPSSPGFEFETLCPTR